MGTGGAEAFFNTVLLAVGNEGLLQEQMDCGMSDIGEKRTKAGAYRDHAGI